MSFSASHFSGLCNGVEALSCTRRLYDSLLIFGCDRRLAVSFVDGLTKACGHTFLNCFKAAIIDSWF